MARSFVGASSQYLEVGTTEVATAVPCTFACWFRTPGLSATGTLMTSNADSTTNAFSLEMNSSELLRATCNGGGAAAVSVAATPDKWHHACAVFATTSSRSVYLDGANKNTSSTGPFTPVGIKTLNVGSAKTTSSIRQNFFTGNIAHAAIWKIALSDEEVLKIGRGYPHEMMRPEHLVAYWPLDLPGDGGQLDYGLRQKYHLTSGTSPSCAPDPVDWMTRPLRRRQQVQFTSEAPAVVGNPWYAYAQM